MRQMKYENIVTSREIYDNLIADFPDDYSSLIDNTLKGKSDSDAEDVLRQLSSIFLNTFLNEQNLFLEEEINYLMDVRDHITGKISELRNKQNLKFLEKKGKLTPEQVDKYLPKVDKEKIERFNTSKSTFSRSTFMLGVLAGIVSVIIFTILFGLLWVIL
jgi:hypothetical protein